MNDLKNTNKIVSQVIEALLSNDASRAVKYVSDKFIVRASRKLYRGKLPRKGENIEVILTIGRPNYAEREFIKICKKAKEPFPLKNIVLKFPKSKKK